MANPRVLVVDDSAFVRTVLSRLLRASGRIDVVGTARDGDDALAQIATSDPDLVTLDLNMPGRDGIGVLRMLQGRPRPRVIIVSMSTMESAAAIEALSLGAVDMISKPTSLATGRLYDIGDELVQKVLAVTAPPMASVLGDHGVAAGNRMVALVLIGTSTGGPQALTRVLAELPADLAAPVAIVLHIPIGYTAALAERLDRSSPLEVVEAAEGVAVRPGRAVLARAGQHLKIVRDGGGFVGHLDPAPFTSHVPSVDQLFASGAEAAHAGVLGVVLTGMGNDGLAGARQIAAAGGTLITESAASCVVYGMPRAVYEAGLGARSIALDQIPPEIIHHVSRR